MSAASPSSADLVPDDLPADAVATYTRRVAPLAEESAATCGPPAPPASPGARGAPSASPSAWSLSFGAPADPRDASPNALPDPAAPSPTAAPTPSPYVLVREVGRGGMGEVWEAVQVSLGRVVAVKRAQERGLSPSPHSLAARDAEFRREAMIAARLEHPNIVPVHDLGADEAGRPLLAMKLVDGRGWDTMLTEDYPRLAPADLLARHLPILIDMAQAVAFAHSRGVVHRDLKPGQVIVGAFGEVMLVDWGLAVYVGDETAAACRPDLPALPSRADVTSPSGTPALMAPEQTEPTAANIGPWTDVYLLGGTLYFLLTGRFPHQARDPRESFLRAQQGDVVPPRERAPDRAMPAELVAVCERALAKDRGARFASAAEFVAALQAHVSGDSRRRASREQAAEAAALLESERAGYEPIAAALDRLERARELWPANPELSPLRERALVRHVETALAAGDLGLARLQGARMEEGGARDALLRRVAAAETRAAAHARQRRVAIIASFVVMLLLLGGGAWFTWRLNAARHAAVHERDRARDARRESDNLVGYMVSDLRERLKALDPDLAVLRDVTEHALEHYLAQPRASLEEEEALPAVERLSELVELFTTQGDMENARRAAEAARELASRFHATHPDDPRWMHAMGVATSQFGFVLHRAAEPGQAAPLLEQGVDLLHRALEGHASVGWRLDLADAYEHSGLHRLDAANVDGGIEHLRAAVATGVSALEIDGAHRAARRKVASSRTWLATALVRGGQAAEAGSELEAAVAVFEELLRETPEDDTVLAAAARALVDAADLQQLRGDIAAAGATYARVREMLGRLLERDPTNVRIRIDLARSMARLGEILFALGEGVEGEQLLRGSVAGFRFLRDLDPADMEHRRNLSTALIKLGSTLQETGRLEEASEVFVDALDVARKAHERDPSDARWVSSVAIALVMVGDLARRMGDADEAGRCYREGIALVAPIVAANAGDLEKQRLAAALRGRLGDTLMLGGDPAGALEEYRLLAAGLGAVAAVDPANVRVAREGALTQAKVGDALTALGRAEEAVQAYGAAVEGLAVLAQGDPQSPQWARENAVLRVKLATALRAGGRTGEAAGAFEGAIAALGRIAAAAPENTDATTDLAGARVERALLRVEAAGAPAEGASAHGALAEAERDFAAAHAMMAAVHTAAPENMRAAEQEARALAGLVDVMRLRGDAAGAAARAEEAAAAIAREAESLAPGARTTRLKHGAYLLVSAAAAHASAGNIDAAFDALARAVAADPSADLRTDPRLAPLAAADPARFEATFASASP